MSLGEKGIPRIAEAYIGHHIQVIAWHIAERSGWQPIVHVKDFTSDNKTDIKHLMFSRLYVTLEEVQRVGFLTSRVWIDSGKPDPSSPVDA